MNRTDLSSLNIIGSKRDVLKNNSLLFFVTVFHNVILCIYIRAVENGGGAGETPAPVPFSGANIFFLRKIGNQKIFPCEKYVTL